MMYHTHTHQHYSYRSRPRPRLRPRHPHRNATQTSQGTKWLRFVKEKAFRMTADSFTLRNKTSQVRCINSAYLLRIAVPTSDTSAAPKTLPSTEKT